MKAPGVLIALLLCALPCPGQDTGRAHGSMFLETGGNAYFGATFNLEFFPAGQVGLRAGAGLDVFSSTPVYPVQFVVLFGATRSKLELAGGVTIATEEAEGNWHWDGTRAFATGFFGYRYQRPQGFLFRIGVVPLFWTNKHLPWVALGFGQSF
jgi:hypothetical protein